MKTYFDCIPCFFRQALDAARLVTDDERVHERVLREAARDLSFAVFGDIQMHNEITRRVIEQVLTARPDLCIVLGDLVNNGSNLEFWEQCRNTLRPLAEACEVVVIPGNHDYDKSGRAEDFCRFFRKPGSETFLSLQRGGCRFILLDTQCGFDDSHHGYKGDFSADSPQSVWLRKELKDAKAHDEPALVFAHHPIFMPTQIYESTSPTIRVDDRSGDRSLGNLLPLLLEGNAQIFFAGHLHLYERSLYNGVHFITTGATGSPFLDLGEGGNRFSKLRLERNHFCLMRVGKDELECEAIDEWSETIDKWVEPFRIPPPGGRFSPAR